MNEHRCLLCMGSNTDRSKHLSEAREALTAAFPDVCFGRLMETEAIGDGFYSPFSNQLASFTTTLLPDAIHAFFKQLECHSGRMPGDKARGIVRLDIDLLMFDHEVLKPEDMKREYIRKGMEEFSQSR